MIIFDTHCHLNFEAFTGQEGEIIARAQKNGVGYFLVPGANLESSQKAVLLAKKYQGVFAAVGIHPHHAQEETVSLKALEKLIQENNPTAIGEVGLDYHQYQQTKYQNYQVDESFKNQQQELFQNQLKLALEYRKPIIIHNREAKEDILPILKENWHQEFSYHAVLHCCEPDEELLNFAQRYHLFVGVDGDVTCWHKKQKFIKAVPLNMLVLETDSPYLTPEPIRKEKPFPNEPKNLEIIAKLVAKIKNVSWEELIKQTTSNASRLFGIQLNQ